MGAMAENATPVNASERRDALTKAVEFLEAGAWQQAHEIVQAERSNLAAWLHGIVHTLEGDLDNARDWYRRAGRDFPGRDAVQEEIAAARRKVTR
jgi:glycine cleavage system aminomethyltransferase T